MKRPFAAGPIFTDLYELTMAQCYWEKKMSAQAVFSLFFRDLPVKRGYFVAAGIDDAIDALCNAAFTEDDMTYLESTGIFSRDFLDWLEGFRFTGEIRAVAEGAIVFENEPLLEVRAPIIEAQIAETLLINQVGFPSLVAAKAARCVEAAGKRPVVDFSARRTQGIDASLKTARCSYMAGFAATSNVLAGKLYGIPVTGTMAHSFVMAHEKEIDAFYSYAEIFPDKCIFLIDTYDTIEGAKLAARVAKQMEKKGKRLFAVRLDSGDMIELSKAVREILDQAGLHETKIFASSGFDEFEIQRLVGSGAVIDAFGVGTKLGVSADAPYGDIVYKMVEYNGRDVAKKSPGKSTLPGEKQVLRILDENGMMMHDIIVKKGERITKAENMSPLLEKIVQNGERIRPASSLNEARQRFSQQYESLPQEVKDLNKPARYPVLLSAALGGKQRSG